MNVQLFGLGDFCSEILPVQSTSKAMADLPPPSTASEEVWKRAERLEITIEDAERLQEGDVKVVYHPSSSKPYKIISQRAY